MNANWEQAAKRGDSVSLADQIAAGADVDALDRFGQSALMLAAQRGHLEVVRVLIRSGADLDKTAKYGMSAAMLAAVNRHDSVARALAEAGADLRIRGSGAPGFAGKTAAQLARDQGLEALADDLARATLPQMEGGSRSR
jgi:ankyrin repeat protein